MLKRSFLATAIFIVCTVYLVGKLVILGYLHPYTMTMTTNIGNSIGQHNHDDFVAVLSPRDNYGYERTNDMSLLSCLTTADKLMNDSIRITISNNFHKKYHNFFIKYCCENVLYGNFCTTFSEQGKQQDFKYWQQVEAEHAKAIRESFERIINE